MALTSAEAIAINSMKLVSDDVRIPPLQRKSALLRQRTIDECRSEVLASAKAAHTRPNRKVPPRGDRGDDEASHEVKEGHG